MPRGNSCCPVAAQLPLPRGYFERGSKDLLSGGERELGGILRERAITSHSLPQDSGSRFLQRGNQMPRRALWAGVRSTIAWGSGCGYVMVDSSLRSSVCKFRTSLSHINLGTEKYLPPPPPPREQEKKIFRGALSLHRYGKAVKLAKPYLP